MSNTTIQNCGILNCNFTKAKLDNAIYWKNNSMFSTFDKASLIGIDIRTSDLTGCDLSGVNLSSAKILYSRIDGSTFANTNLQHAKVNQSIFNNVVFTNSNVEGVDFSGAFFNGYSMGLLRKANNLDLSSRHEAMRQGEESDW